MKNLFYLIIFAFVLKSCQSGSEDSLIPESFRDAESDTLNSIYFGGNGSGLINNNLFKYHSYQDSSGSEINYILKVEESMIFPYKSDGNNRFTNIEPIVGPKGITNWKIGPSGGNYNFNKNIIEFNQESTDFNEASFHLYNIDKGNLLLNYTYGRLEATFPDGIQKRFFGFYSSKGPNGQYRESNDFSFTSNFIGAFSYASDEEKISGIVLRAKNSYAYDSLDKSTPVMEFVTDTTSDHLSLNNGRGLYLSGEVNNGASLNMSIKNTFYYGAKYKALEVIIPIKNDAIDYDNIQYNPNYFTIEIIR